MSKIKINEDLFLEVCELNRLQKFLKEDGYLKLLKYAIKNFGIVRDDNNLFFKVNQKTGSNNAVIVNSGIAIDSELNIITNPSSVEIIVPNDGNKHWLITRYNKTNLELGTVSVTNNGTLTGAGTEFSKVLRGGFNSPNKVRFISDNNINDYEVLSVLSDGSAVLNGNFIAETNLRYCVIGAFTPGVLVNPDNELIYEYDFCDIIDIPSSVQPNLNDGDFLLAEIEYASGVMSVNDLRNLATFNENPSQSSSFEDPIVSLLETNLTGEKQIDLIIEHGYKISSLTFLPQAENNIARVIGSCNYLGSGDIPNDYFKNWILLNRANMKKAVIKGNSNKDLSIPTMDSSFILGSGNDFIIIPNFKEIEFEILITGSDVPLYKKYNLENLKNRFSIPVDYGLNKVVLKYRLLGENSTVLKNLCSANFTNILGGTEALVNSTFNTTITQNVVLKNYS